MKYWVSILFFIATPASTTQAAAVLPDLDRFVWNFTLLATPDNSNSTDQFSIQFGTDRLTSGEILLVNVFANGQSLATYTKTLRGQGTGTNGYLYFGDLDAVFPGSEGSVTLDMVNGTVEIARLSIRFNTPVSSAFATLSPELRLVPEPGIPMMILGGFLTGILIRRRP